MAGRIVISAALAQKAGHGGLTWAFLQFVLGFKRLGWDVLLLDRLEPGMCVDSAGQPCALYGSVNLRYMLDVVESFDLAGSFSLLYDHGRQVVGLSRRRILDYTSRAAVLLNVMGYLTDEEILGAAPQRAFLDIDPGFGQMWRELGSADVFHGHDVFVTIGENVGQPDCEIPTCGLRWVTTPPPVVLDYWPTQTGSAGQAFTSIASWRGPYGPVEFRGKVYGLRVHEFRKFVSLPRVTGRQFELALNIHPAEEKDLSLLANGGWSLVDPRVVASDPWAYRTYIQSSRAEFTVAKNMYVQTNSGWFSDRSVCYLASGKPVVAQDTGIRDRYPTGEGLLTFGTLAEASRAVEDVWTHYPRHARAARIFAEEYFNSDRVLSALLGKLGVA